MQYPANAAAREIERLRSVNRDIDEQIRVLREKQLENSELIGNHSQVAEWTVEPGPDPEPASEVVDPEAEEES
ncbi:hypothetical protein [Leucobacter sp.]